MQFTSSKNIKPQKASFYKDLAFSDNSVVITPLIESSFGKEIRITFKSGQVMKKHKTRFPITVMTLKGCIEFIVNEEMTILKEGDIIALEGDILHELKATKESVVWLSLSKRDDINRVMDLSKS